MVFSVRFTVYTQTKPHAHMHDECTAKGWQTVGFYLIIITIMLVRILQHKTSVFGLPVATKSLTVFPVNYFVKFIVAMPTVHHRPHSSADQTLV